MKLCKISKIIRKTTVFFLYIINKKKVLHADFYFLGESHSEIKYWTFVSKFLHKPANFEFIKLKSNQLCNYF